MFSFPKVMCRTKFIPQKKRPQTRIYYYQTGTMEFDWLCSDKLRRVNLRQGRQRQHPLSVDMLSYIRFATSYVCYWLVKCLSKSEWAAVEPPTVLANQIATRSFWEIYRKRSSWWKAKRKAFPSFSRRVQLTPLNHTQPKSSCVPWDNWKFASHHTRRPSIVRRIELFSCLWFKLEFLDYF